jgi:hypothetical protein
MSSNFGSVPKLLFSVDARKTFLLKGLLSSRSGDDCCVIRPLVRGLCIVSKFLNLYIFAFLNFFVSSWHIVSQCDTVMDGCHHCDKCHTCHKYHCHVSLVIKCVVGGLLVTDFKQVRWEEGCGGQKVIPRPLATTL